MQLRCRDHILDLSSPLIMGILNVTPDSFYDGGKHFSLEDALEHARIMQEQGADIIDVGAESTRPGAIPVCAKDELLRISPLIFGLYRRTDLPLSIDTYKGVVARACLAVGAHIINDVRAGEDLELITAAKTYGVPLVLMHHDKSENPGNSPSEVRDYLGQRAEYVREQGIEQVVVDPGFGFGKTPNQNYRLAFELRELSDLGYPVLAGFSQKRFWDGNRRCSQEEIARLCVDNGANMLRVHDVERYRNL